MLSEESESRNNHRYAVVVQDLATQWIQSYPCKSKSSQETQKNLMKFQEPTRNPKVIYTDNSLEFGKSCEDLSWNHCTSTPHRSETNGTAERAVRRVKEGTSAVLLQSGLDENWWADSMDCYCFLRNIQDKPSDGKTPYERRFGVPCNGTVIPFGAMVDHHPISAKDQSRLHQFGAKVLPGIFLGYALYAGGIWKGDIMVADIEELEEMDASELHARRLNAKEVLTPRRSGKFIFPVAGQRLRTSTLTRDRPERGEEQKNLQGNSDEWYTPSHPQEDSTRDDEDAKNDFWTITGEFIYRHHAVPRVKLYVPKEESFPIPLKYIDVTRNTHTSLDVMLEKNIDDYWNVDGENELSDAWAGNTRFILLNERPPDGYTWSGRRLTRKQTTSCPDCVWPDMWKHMSDAAKKKAKQKWAIEKPKLDNARQLRGKNFIKPDDEEFKLILTAARRKLEVPMPAAMPSKIPIKNSGETHGSSGKRKTKYACVDDADESTRPRLEGAVHKHHQDHVTEKGMNSMNLSQIHSDASSNENSRCKGSSGKRIGKLVKIRHGS